MSKLAWTPLASGRRGERRSEVRRALPAIFAADLYEVIWAMKGTYEELAVAFRALVDDYIAAKYPRRQPAPAVIA